MWRLSVWPLNKQTNKPWTHLEFPPPLPLQPPVVGCGGGGGRRRGGEGAVAGEVRAAVANLQIWKNENE